ncbi:MAG: 2-hydroxyacyl-CoA dehydratase family protein [Bacillota bacterium]|jgi:benzoyl-CoA reductase/2-hydroxyglutaryl-CoA dehydratase subunit BcrC/BadD/HgdB
MDQKNLRYDDQAKLERKKERLFRQMVMVANRFLRRALELSGVPYSFDYFSNILKRIYIELQGVEREAGVKTIGTYCVMVPPELIYAAGAMPVKLCSGSYTGFNIGDEICPRDSCPLIKAAIGCTTMKLLPIYHECDLTVIPTSCDCKKKMPFVLSPYIKVAAFHVPTIKLEDEFKEAFCRDLYLLKRDIEAVTAQKITYPRLKLAIAAVASAQQEINRFYTLKMHQPAVIKGTHAMMVINSYSYDRVDRWAQALHALNDELEMRIVNQKYVAKAKTPRIMITGAPVIFPNIKIPLLIEELGGILVADETCMGERGLYDPVAVTEASFDGMMRGLAARQILPCTCPTFIRNEQRIFKLKQMIADFQVEGVIYHVLRGCLVYDFEFPAVEAVLAELGIPAIRIETDYNEEDVEQLRVRMEAFLEMIKFQKEDSA